ncbi:MAG TPA: ATP-binding protein [Mycobacteriales bacterium]|nr:ATP-binding protein [Mycobacteriales bacterium]
MRFTLQLPRDALSVPVVRRVLDQSMRTLGVTGDCRTDIGVALSEACTNVLDHATNGEEYEVVADVADESCVIEVVDTGRGFSGDDYGHTAAEETAEDGRGIQLMRALVDRVHFRSKPGAGTVVHLEKQVRYDDDAPFHLLAMRGGKSLIAEDGAPRTTTTSTDRLDWS